MFEDIYKAHNHDGNVKEPRSSPKKHPPISTEFGLAKKQPKSGLEWGMGTAPPAPDTPQVNLLAVKKSGRPRKVK
jgi:hypothetical protein